MVIKGMFASNPVKQVFDDYYTRKSAWSDIQEYIPRDKVIWEACMLNSTSSSPDYLTELGFEVEFSTSEDIFTQQKREGSIIVSNLPFSLKRRYLDTLKT